jgi:two-component system nitrogen regulation response regulator GlnG
MKPVWIVDDDQSIRWVLEKALARAGVSTQSFASADAARAALESATPSVLVTDIRMPGGDGLALLHFVKQRYPDLAVIIMTAFTDLDSTVAAFQKGAFDYLAKPFDINTAVALIQRAAQEHLQNAAGEMADADAALSYRAASSTVPSAFSASPASGAGAADARQDPDAAQGHVSRDKAMVPSAAARGDLDADSGHAKKTAAAQPSPIMMQSSSVAMQEVFRAIGRLAASPATVLITGESGTGKELIARALHEHSTRAGGPFIALNAAAIPRDLLEAELFGHERGAFTGATQLRRGRFEAADRGTLFLDEIGDMPLELQTRLLRVLAEGSFYRVGGSQALSVDVRIVAATHQPLEQRVAQGQFREDLFHRLNVIRLRLPPLRERKEDIPALAKLFLQKSAHSLGVPLRRVTPAALKALTAFDYPGNIRQLENFCHWLTVMSASQVVDLIDLPPEVLSPSAFAPAAAAAATTTTAVQPSSAEAPPPAAASWAAILTDEVKVRLARNEPAVMSSLMREFERVLLDTALQYSRGRRAEAAQRLGIGRNTLTRKYSELGFPDDSSQR